MPKTLDELIARAKALPGEKTIAVCGADDEHLTALAKELAEIGLCKTILVGSEEKILALYGGVLPDGVSIVNEPDRAASCLKAVGLVSGGAAQVFVKGMMNTKDFLRAVLNKDCGLRTGRQLNVMTCYEIPGQEKLLFVADGGMVVAPGLESKVQILDNCIPVLHSLGIDEPKIAILAANEQVSPGMPATVDAADIVALADAGKLPRGIYEGPMALDVIMRREAAEIKGLESRVSGDADFILVPSIETGNCLGKAIGYFGHGVMAGIVVGAAKPVIMSSRAGLMKSKIASVAWALLSQKENV